MTDDSENRETRIRRFGSLLRRRPIVSAASAVVLAAAGAWVIFGFFGFHTLFFNETVNEANPFAADPAPSGLEIDVATDETTTTTTDALDDSTGEDEPVDEPIDEPTEGTLVEGTFIDRAHPTTGIAKVITDGEQRFLRLEDFKTDNGPDLNVYLTTTSPDGGVGEDYIDLGNLKGNIGDQNYELSPEIDLDRYTSVFIWCVRFSVAFGAAALA